MRTWGRRGDRARTCRGRGECDFKYAGEKCAKCAAGYYRSVGECILCPDDPWLLLVFMIVTALGVVILAHILERSNVNLGMLDIGINYFQVVAMFMRAKVPWPDEIRDLMKLFSIFSINFGAWCLALCSTMLQLLGSPSADLPSPNVPSRNSPPPF